MLPQIEFFDIRPFIIKVHELAGQEDTRLFDLSGNVNPSDPNTLTMLMLRQARFTLLSGLYICSGTEGPSSDWVPEMMLTVAQLNRNLLDVLFNLIFLFENPIDHAPWYLKAGWRDAALELERLRLEFGDLPGSKEELTRRDQQLAEDALRLRLTNEEWKNPKLVSAWPSPSNMISYRLTKFSARPPHREVIRYLYDHFFVQFSWAAHAHYFGFRRTASILFRANLLPDQRSVVERVHIPALRGSAAELAALFFLCITTEIDLQYQFGLASQLFKCWEEIMSFPTSIAVQAQLVYTKGYKDRPTR
jgi:hypothetical protein